MTKIVNGHRSGRETKYRKEMDQIAIDKFALGWNRSEVFRHLDCKYHTFLNWLDPKSPTHQPSFLAAVQEGEQLSRAWYEEFARNGLRDNTINNHMFGLIARNRFGYDSKQKVEVTGAEGAPLILNIKL